MDKLSKDATDALNAGMSYGKYMAVKNPTKISPPEPKGVRQECQHCGNVFYRYDGKARKYCSDRCRKNAENQRARQPVKPTTKICPVCGKEFAAATWRNKYCSPFCAQAAQVEQVREYQARQREKDGGANAKALAK